MRMRDDSDPTSQREILNRLCQCYWQPLFQYARRLGNPPEPAQDLTQGFFVQLLTKQLFNKANRERGKLRTLLLTAFSNYIHDEHDKAGAIKRGSNEVILSLEGLEDAETAYQIEADENSSPEVVYDKRYARDCLAAAAKLLEDRHVKDGKSAHYDSLKQFISVSGDKSSYTLEAANLGLPGGEGHYKVLVQRFRDQFKKALLEVVRDTLPDDATEEDVRLEVLEIIRLAYG